MEDSEESECLATIDAALQRASLARYKSSNETSSSRTHKSALCVPPSQSTAPSAIPSAALPEAASKWSFSSSSSSATSNSSKCKSSSTGRVSHTRTSASRSSYPKPLSSSRESIQSQSSTAARTLQRPALLSSSRRNPFEELRVLRNRCLGRSSGSGAKQKPFRPEPEPEPESEHELEHEQALPAVSVVCRPKQRNLSSELLPTKCVPSSFPIAPAIAVGSNRVEVAAAATTESHAVTTTTTSTSALASRSQSVGPRQNPNPTVAAAQHRSISNTQLARPFAVATHSAVASANGSAPAARAHTPTRPLRSRSAVIRERISTLYVCTLRVPVQYMYIILYNLFYEYFCNRVRPNSSL